MPSRPRASAGALVDAGIVRVESGQARCDDKALAAFAVPDSIQGAVISRIDRLSLRQQMTLKKASVVGRSFTLEALASADAGDVSAGALAQGLGPARRAIPDERSDRCPAPAVPCSLGTGRRIPDTGGRPEANGSRHPKHHQLK